jgi:hypothetical protein
MPSEMHHRDDLDCEVPDPVDDTVRKTVNEVASYPAVLILERPHRGRIPHSPDGAVDLVKKLPPEVVRALFVPGAGVFKFRIYVGMDVNAVHGRSGRVDL